MIISDFDDTLYYNGLISKKDIEAISDFRKDNNVFVIATGSSYTSFKRKIKGFDLEYDYLIINHGTGILKEDKLIYDQKIDKNILEKIIEKYNLNLSENYTLIRNTEGNFFSTSREGLVRPNTSQITKIHIEFNKDNYKKELSYLKSVYGKYLNIYEILSNYAIELISNKTSKLNAIEKLIKIENINKGNIYTIGDGYSDVEMISKYNGYAVPNAIDDVKKVCIRVIKNVGELINVIYKK